MRLLFIVTISNNFSHVSTIACKTVIIYNMYMMFSFRTTFSEFAMKYGKDDRFKGIEKMKDRESLFTESMAELKKKEKESLKLKQDKVGFLFLWGGM